MAVTYGRRTGAQESPYMRRAREGREDAQLTVRCEHCGWSFTGRTVTAVGRAKRHRAKYHPELPVETPPPPRASDYCKVAGCRERAATKAGRYARLCAAHREEAQALVAAPRPARVRPRRQRGDGTGHSHTRRDPSRCKVDGCGAVPARTGGRFAFLCAEHYEVQRAAAYGPRQPPRVRARAGAPARPLGQCKVPGCTEPWVRARSRGAHLCAAHLEAYTAEHYPLQLLPRAARKAAYTPRGFTPAMERCAVALLDAPLTVVQVAHAAVGPWGFSSVRVLERVLYEMQTRLGLQRGRRPMPQVPVYNRAEVEAMVAAAVQG